MQDIFLGGNQVVPVFDDHLLPVFGAIAVPSDILMKKMRIGNYPGVESDFELVVCNHPLIIFLYLELVRERPGRLFLVG